MSNVVQFELPLPKAGWPISTAPRTGKRILLYCKDCVDVGQGVVIGSWEDGWTTESCLVSEFAFEPTHWAEIPAIGDCP